MVRCVAVVIPIPTTPPLPAKNIFPGRTIEALSMLVVVMGTDPLPKKKKLEPGPPETPMSYDAPEVGAPGAHERVLGLDKYQVALVAGAMTTGSRIVGGLEN